MLKFRIIILSLGIGSLLACTEAPTPVLSGDDKNMVDSLFAMRYDSLRLELDSLCVIYNTDGLEAAVDSLYKVRLLDKVRLKERNNIYD